VSLVLASCVRAHCKTGRIVTTAQENSANVCLQLTSICAINTTSAGLAPRAMLETCG